LKIIKYINNIVITPKLLTRNNLIVGFGTQDQYAIGDLSGKLQGRKKGSYHNDILPGSAKLSGIYWDTYLPLSGIHSIVHRSLVLYK